MNNDITNISELAEFFSDQAPRRVVSVQGINGNKRKSVAEIHNKLVKKHAECKGLTLEESRAELLARGHIE